MRDTDAATGPARMRVRPRAIAWSLIAGALLGGAFMLVLAPPRGERFEARQAWAVALPGVQDWPRAPRDGETTRLERGARGATLVVTSTDAASARLLARAFAAVQSPTEETLRGTLAQVRLGWRSELTAERTLRPTPTAECASLLLARAIWGRTLADRLPIPSPLATPPVRSAPEAVYAAWRDVRAAAEARRPGPLATALHDATERETAWFADPAAWRGTSAPARAEAWRRWQDERSDEMETLAERMLSGRPTAESRLAELGAHPRMVALDEDLHDPWRAFASPDPATLRPLVLPNPRLWLPPLLFGGALGGLVSLLVMLLGAWSRSRGARAELGRLGLRAADPGALGPSLHVVSGATAVAVTCAALELAARRIALGERVLLVDGSSRLRLHERLGRDARWGLLECLAADMPMLGLVQYAGHPGLYLLPHGKADRAVGWSRLGRKLDEVEPHFARIVLALDPQAPGELGDELRGRAMEGWWGHVDGGLAGAADRATARFGIIFHPLVLSELADATLEALAGRVIALRPAGPAPEPAPITARTVAPAPTLPQPVHEPIVLDCDLQVRERLRFLAWMRRLQAQNRDAELEVTS
jgi:hypothetical protein